MTHKYQQARILGGMKGDLASRFHVFLLIPFTSQFGTPSMNDAFFTSKALQKG
jgi:hypothetical protein